MKAGPGTLTLAMLPVVAKPFGVALVWIVWSSGPLVLPTVTLLLAPLVTL